MAGLTDWKFRQQQRRAGNTFTELNIEGSICSNIFEKKIALSLKRISLMQNQTLYKWTFNGWKTMMP